MITKSQLLQQKFTVSTYPNRGLTFASGRGSYLITESGDRYLDMMTNYGVNILGYGQTSISRKIADQIAQLPSLNSSFNNTSRAQASQKLIRAINKDLLTRVFWSSSGTEAVEAALKFAVICTERSQFLAAHGSYHGKTLGSLSVTTAGKGKYQKQFKKMLASTDYFDFGDIKSLKSVISHKHAALIIEPIQGEAGVVVPPQDFLPRVRTLCKQHGVLLVVDEIQTGVGRTGSFLNIDQYDDMSCDILCLAKGLGYGLPVGATVISEKINKSLSKGVHTSTFGGNPISMAAVGAVVDYIFAHEALFDQVKENGTYLLSELKRLQASYSESISRIEGQGLMIGIETSIDPLILIKALQRMKIIVAPTSLNRLRLLPPLTIKKSEIDHFIKQFELVLQEVSHV